MTLSKCRLIVLLLLCPVMGCSTSSYKISNTDVDPGETYGKYEVLATPDRIQMECENLQTDDIVSYGFSLYVLDEENTVAAIAQTNRIGKSGCQERFHKIGKILKGGSQIYIGGIGDLGEPRKKLKYRHYFPKHGTFHGNGRVLQLRVVANEHGKCFDVYRGSEKPCPGKKFSYPKTKIRTF